MANAVVGFIGLGEMGEPMVARLLGAGYTVVSCAHRRREAIERLRKQGLVEEADPRAAAERVDILLTIVVDEAQTDRVLRGSRGALAGLRKGSTIVLMSTLSPEYCQALAAEAARMGIEVIDCPVSGARPRAEAGTLTLIAGGDRQVVERHQLVLETMGRIYYAGGVGMGMVVKLANNAIGFATSALVLEARAFARAYGADMDILMDVCRNGTANSFVVQAWDWIAANMAQLKPLGLKDAELCRAAAATKAVPMPMLDAYLAQDWSDVLAARRHL